MNELIRIERDNIGEDEVQTVNARDLHKFLEVKMRFNDWIVRRIEEYGFAEGEDFCYSILSSKPGQRGGHNRRDYHLTLNMAKEVAMVERTDKGREARRYFIMCEKIAHEKMADAIEEGDDLSTVKDRTPLYHGAVDMMLAHRLSLGKAYQALNWYAGVGGFRHMTKKHAKETAAFITRILSGDATLRDFQRIETNRAALAGEVPQLQLITMAIPLIYGGRK